MAIGPICLQLPCLNYHVLFCIQTRREKADFTSVLRPVLVCAKVLRRRACLSQRKDKPVDY